jgi:alcohol oxidase
MYTRASASDYDDFQAKGWTTKELIPLMKKHETYQRSCNNRDLHGFEGPIKVSFGNYCYPIKEDFLRAVETQGIPTTDDLQDLVTGHGAEHWLKWINRDTGRRSDSAHAYIHSTRAVHQNLHLLTSNKVEKVSHLSYSLAVSSTLTLDRSFSKATAPSASKSCPLSTWPTAMFPRASSGRVSKSSCRAERSVHHSSSSARVSATQRSFARRASSLSWTCQVWVSTSRTTSKFVEDDCLGVIADLVTSSLTFATYRAKPHVESFDDFARGDPATQERVFQQWNINGTGPLATNGIEAGVKIRPTEEELKMMDSWPCPEFRSGWDSYFKDKPDKPVMHYSVIAGWFGDHMVMPPGKFFTMFRKFNLYLSFKVFNTPATVATLSETILNDTC